MLGITTKGQTIKQALEIARHELTTLHNLTVTDNPESGASWVSDTSVAVNLIDQAISELSDIQSHLS